MTGKCGEKQVLLHDWKTLSEHNLSIMTQWEKHKTVILLALKHSIIEKTLEHNMLKPNVHMQRFCKPLCFGYANAEDRTYLHLLVSLLSQHSFNATCST